MRGYYALLMVVMVALLAGTACASSRPNIIVSGFDVDGMAAVGNDFTLVVNLTNIGGVCAMTTTVSVAAMPPFISNGVSTTVPVDICPGETQTVRMPLRIDPTATGGSYPLTLTTQYNDVLTTPYTTSDTLDIAVEGTPDLQARIADSNPVDVYPGDTATITIQVDNAGTFQAQSITGVLSADAPVEVKWSRSTMTTGTLDAKQSVSADFAVEVPKDAAAKDYPLTLTLHYLDENRQQRTKEFPLTLTVAKKALFATSDGGSDPLYANDASRIVRLKLTNIGTDVAKKLKVTLQPQYPFTTDGSLRYVDSLAPGESAQVDFVVNVDKDGTAGTYGLQLVLNFEDRQGKLLHDTADASLTLLPTGIVKAVFVNYWYLWVAAIVIAAIVVLRKRRKKQHK